jgi:flagellar basal-body rod protein FlgC
MDFVKSIAIAASGLKAQAGRMRILSENIANADSTAQNPADDPYRRRIPTFTSTLDRALDARTVALGPVATDPAKFVEKYQPGHPAANAQGYVKFPNINSLVETTDMRSAQRSYEANVNVIGAARRMISRTLDILKS